MTESGPSRTAGLSARFFSHLGQPVSSSSLAALRLMFGLLMAAGSIRFCLSGWVEELFVRPTFFFKYDHFEWMPVWSPTGLYVHFAIVILAALMVAAGAFYRIAIFIFGMSFLGIQLMDQSNYLNHYYLVLNITLLLGFLPAHCAFSVDSIRKPTLLKTQIPRWIIYLLRFQVAIVYVFASIAKMGEDWLFRAQPLSIWLGAQTDLPLVGSYIDAPWVAFAASWAGCLYDLFIVPLLIFRPTRILAYGAVLLFHGFTFVLFDIGMFPFIMIVLTTIFFEPDWALKAAKRLGFKTRQEAVSIRPQPTASWIWVCLVVWCCIHVGTPLRHHFYGGNVLWHEKGMNYSWRVMVREKMGAVTFRVKRISDGREWSVSPLDYLEMRQMSEMSGQPSLIKKLAEHIRYEFQRKGRGDVEVRVDALVSLNGRPPAPMIDPTIDISRELEHTKWILPQPNTPALNPWAGR